MDLIRLVTQLPLSELGERLLHLQAGSKLGLYLLELSNLPLGPGAVEEAETNLSPWGNTSLCFPRPARTPRLPLVSNR